MMRDHLLKPAEQAETDAALIASLKAENAALKARIRNATAALKKALGITEDTIGTETVR
ncbi:MULTISPECIES: hypothetical protein [Bradyrhizobium]|uniref:hypothetical protein n=1 Tax=Bradyrhizobium TaxID=374 RepID=UPI001EDA5FEF|nr:hypothetical protein [Bradyrhizobium zhengyangense]MCG2639423.1 hypothetical protein [Bradyrhizobium zhengyangense]